MKIDITNLDAGFMTVDADATLGDVVDLVHALSPSSVVVREAPGFGDLDDDEDDVFFVFAPDMLLERGLPYETPIGQLAMAAGAEPAIVFETLPRWREPAPPPPPRRRGSGLESFAGPAAEATAVILSDGSPDGIAPTGAEPPDGGGGDLNGGGDGDDDRAVGIALDYPRSVAVGETMSLLIALTADLGGADVIPVVAQIGDEIDVVVSPRSGFVVDGPSERTLTVGAEGEPLPIQIKLRATTVGPSSIAVYAFRDGAPLGALTIAPVVVAKDAAAAGDGDRAISTATLDAATPPDADLQLVILEERDEHGQPKLKFLLTGRDPSLGLNLKPFGPITLEGGPGGYFTALYREIERLPVETEEQRAEASERLHAIGSTLFVDLIPDDLRTLLWELRDRIRTVWVQSDEPYVPWELCRLQGTAADGRVVEGEFFCEAFALTRWIPGIGRRPELRLTNVGLIVPGDSGLTNVAAERKMVHGLARAGRSVEDIPPHYVDVRKAFASADYDGIHFSGHGKFPDDTNPARAEIELERGSKLRPTDLGGVATNFGLRRPLVFLNACQVGRQSQGLTGVGGWASALLRNGAAAFVGTHWEVTDDLALTFAETLYASLDAGETIATATREARMAIRDTGDPTWLAYTVFADPGATLAA